jgi:hypothetical protein
MTRPLRGARWIETGAAAGLLAILATGGAARAGGNIEAVVNGNTNIVDAVWDVGHALPIPWRINAQGVVNNCNNGNPTCVGGVSPLTLQRAIDAMTAAFNAWQNLPTSNIAFTYAGTTTQTSIGTDNIHLITWADANVNNCPTGVVATTPNTALAANLTLTSTNRDVNSDGIIDIDPAIYPNGTVLKAGTIIDADMAWCPGGSDFVDVPLDTTTYTFDVIAVGTHELGHFHGLSHSSLISPLATLTPFVDNTASYASDARVLAQDDIAASSRYYPETSQAAGFGAITGRLFLPGGTTPATGVSVTAFNKITGEMAVQVFTVTQFTPTPATTPPGSFKIDWLPPGTYYVGIEYFDSTTGSSGGGDDDWWDNNRFNYTIYNGFSGGTRPAIARPEFYSSPENSTDDLADQVPVPVPAGQSVGIGSIIINTDNPPAPSGATPLSMGNDTAVQVPFPAGFSFPFFGTAWTSVFVNDNANLTFGAASTSSNTGNFLGPDVVTHGPVPPRIALPLTDIDPGFDNQGQSGGPLDVFWRYVSDAQGDRMEFTWLGTPVIGTTKSCTMIAWLFRDGRIEIQKKFAPAWWGIEGVSPGGNGTEPRLEIDMSRQLPVSGGPGQAIYEHFGFAQPPINGGTNALGDASDLNGSLIIYRPNAQGGYDVSSPTFVIVPPGEVQNLRFTTQTAFAWDAQADALSYNVYRGGLGAAAFLDADKNGAADGYGACLDASIGPAADSDAALPAVGAGFHYLVTGRNAAGEGPLGAASSGAPRPNVAACP